MNLIEGTEADILTGVEGFVPLDGVGKGLVELPARRPSELGACLGGVKSQQVRFVETCPFQPQWPQRLALCQVGGRSPQS